MGYHSERDPGDLHPRPAPHTNMAHLHIVRSLLAMSLLTSAPILRAAEELPSLFDGKTLSGWSTFENPSAPFWKVEGGCIVGENDEKLKGSILFTQTEFHDVSFETDVKWSSGADTGIFYRLSSPLTKAVSPESGKAALLGPNQAQVQIGISGSLKRDMTGSIYIGNYPEEGRGKGVDAVLKSQDWNRIRVEIRGDTVIVWINGTEVTRYTDARFPGRAPLGLQIHPNKAMKIEFRNLRAKALD
jgi:hypothetical protein